jgi:hypothetical protein
LDFAEFYADPPMQPALVEPINCAKQADGSHALVGAALTRMIKQQQIRLQKGIT